MLLQSPHVFCIITSVFGQVPAKIYCTALCPLTDCPLLCAVLLWDTQLWVTWHADSRLQLHMRHRLDHICPAGPGQLHVLHRAYHQLFFKYLEHQFQYVSDWIS